MVVTAIPIHNLIDKNKGECFDMNPINWAMKEQSNSVEKEWLITAAQTAAAEWEDICICYVFEEKDQRLMAITTFTVKNPSPRLLLLNAEECTKAEADICAKIEFPDHTSEQIWIRYKRESYV